MRRILVAVGLSVVLGACSGGGGGLPGGVKKKADSDISGICVDYDKARLKGGSGDPARKALMKQIDKTCCPQVAKGAKKLDAAGKALVWYAFARQMDNVYSPDDIRKYDDGFEALKGAMTPDDFDAAYDAFEIRFSCGTDLERKAGLSPY